MMIKNKDKNIFRMQIVRKFLYKESDKKILKTEFFAVEVFISEA